MPRDLDDAGSDVSFDDDDMLMAPPDDFSSSIVSPQAGNIGNINNNNTQGGPKSSAMAKIMSSHGINARAGAKDGLNQSNANNNNLGASRSGGSNLASPGHGSLNFADSHHHHGGGHQGGNSNNNNMNASSRGGPLPQVKSETVAASREAYQLEQALRFHMVMKPKAETASPTEQSHILSHVLSFFVHNGFSRSAEALFRSGAVSQPIAAAVRDGPYRDMPRILGSAVSATSELFDDDTPWESELLFRFAGNNNNSSSNGGGGNNSNSAADRSSMYPTHDFVILDERTRAQLGTIEFLMTKLVLEQNDIPFAARHRFDVNFSNVFLTTCFGFCTPDAFVAKCLKLFKAMQLHVSLLGEQTVINGCRRLLIILAAYVSSNRIDVGRTTLERLLSLAVSILTHASSSPSSGSAEVAQAAQQLLAAIEELERSAASCGAFADLPGASQLRKSVSHAMNTFGVASSSVVATGSTPTLMNSSSSSTHTGFGAASGGGAASRVSGQGVSLEPSLRWKSLPFLPFGVPPVDVPRSAFRGDGPLYKLSDVPETEVARQLTLMHFALFQKISPREFVSGAWMNSSMSSIAANLIRFIEQEEMVTYWVASTVIMPAEPSERRAAYARMVRIMRLLFDMQNYSLASSFFSGLENSSLRRMSRTVSGSLSDDEQASYDVVKSAMNPFTGSLKSIPQEMRTSCIPLLAPFVGEACRLHDLQQNVVVTTLDMPQRQDAAEAAREQQQQQQQQQKELSEDPEGGSSSIHNQNNNNKRIKKVPTKVHLVNWSKMISVAKIMLKLSSFQSRPYAFDPDSVVQRLLQRLPLTRKDPERLYQLSLEREPSASNVTGPLVS